MIKIEIKQKILDAANQLVSEGVNDPTNDQVREFLGGGSLSHISPVMREWRSNRKEAVAIANEMPAALKNIVELSLTQIWSTATKIAFADFENSKNESLEVIANVSLERDEALAEVQRLEDYIKTLELESSSQKEKIHNLEDANRALAVDVISTQKENNAQAILLQDRKEQITELKQSINDLQNELIKLVKSN